MVLFHSYVSHYQRVEWFCMRMWMFDVLLRFNGCRSSWSMSRVLRGAVIRPIAHKAALFTSSRWRRPTDFVNLCEGSTDFNWFQLISIDFNWFQLISIDFVGKCHRFPHIGSYWIMDSIYSMYSMYSMYPRQTTTRAGVYMAVSSWWSPQWWTVCPRTRAWLLCAKATIDTVEFLGRLGRGAKQWILYDTLIEPWFRRYSMTWCPIIAIALWLVLLGCAILRWTQIN